MIDLARGPMLATLVDELPVSGPNRRLLYEPKWDGFRALARELARAEPCHYVVFRRAPAAGR